MPTYRKYAPGVWISAAVAVGAALWFSRPQPYVAAQDAAELHAAAAERLWALATGSGAPTWPSNSVDEVARSAVVASALDALRGLATNDAAGVYWLDPVAALPADGAVVGASAGYAWARGASVTNGPVVERQWTYGGPSASTPYFLTLSTRWPASLPVVLWGCGGTNVPAASWFASAATPDAAASWYWGGVGNWWSYAGLGTNLYAWPRFERVGGGLPFGRSPYIATNALDDARTLARAMSRTIRIYGAGDFASGVTVTGAVIRTQGDFSHLSNGLFTGQAMYWRARAEAAASATTTTNMYGAFEPRLAYIDLNAYATEADHGAGAFYGAYGDCDFERVSNVGVRCSYPSAAACASGLVSRVRVYAVAWGRPSYTLDVWPEQSGGSGIAGAGAYTNAAAYTADNHPTDGYDDEPLGTGLDLATHTFDGFLRWPYLYDLYQPWQAAPAIPSAFPPVAPYLSRWSLVCDVSDPSDAPAFDLGSTLDPTTVGHNQYSKVKAYDLPPDDANYEQLEQYAFRQQIDVRHLAVVVDWSWRHLGDPADAAEPELYTPGWASTNAP